MLTFEEAKARAKNLLTAKEFSLFITYFNEEVYDAFPSEFHKNQYALSCRERARYVIMSSNVFNVKNVI